MRATFILVCGLALCASIASAAAPSRSRGVGGGRAAPAFLILKGKVTEGGAPSTFEKVVDLANGHSRTTRLNGPKTEFSGFDGAPWVASNGAVVAVDAPGPVEEARAHAFVDRLGWTRLRSAGDDRLASPKGASPLHVHGGDRPDEIIIDGDDGPISIRFGDWRTVGGLAYPFHQEEKDATGETTIWDVESATLAAAAPLGSLARPRAEPHGSLATKNVLVPVEIRGTYILAKAQINGIGTQLIFDTGGANYLGPQAAHRLGLTVSGGLNLSGPGTGSVTGGFARVDRIAIGGAELRDEAVMVGPLPWPPKADGSYETEGSTGYEFISEFRTTIDYGAQTLSFSRFQDPLPRGGQKLRFLSDGHSPFVYATVNGRRGLFRVDTGDGDAVNLFKRFATRSGLDRLSGETVHRAGVGGEFVLKRVRIDRFEIGGAEVRDVAASISQTNAGSFSSRTLAGNLGGKLFRCFTLTIDYHARYLVLEQGPNTEACLAKLH